MLGKSHIAAVLLMGAIIYCTRLLPFLFFRKKEIPPLLVYLERNIPPLIMLLLVMYCMKDVAWRTTPFGAPYVLGVGVVVAMHLWKGNALLSIFAGTVVHMVGLRIW